MNRKRLTIITVVLCLAFLMSCTWSIGKPKPFTEMTSKEKLAYMYQIYNAQYDDYLYMVKIPNLTESQKTMLRNKKKIFVTVEPLIATYDTMVQRGTPTKEQEQEIYKLLNQLQTNLSG